MTDTDQKVRERLEIPDGFVREYRKRGIVWEYTDPITGRIVILTEVRDLEILDHIATLTTQDEQAIEDAFQRWAGKVLTENEALPTQPDGLREALERLGIVGRLVTLVHEDWMDKDQRRCPVCREVMSLSDDCGCVGAEVRFALSRVLAATRPDELVKIQTDDGVIELQKRGRLK